ncbi:ABC transporter ATP-binding protein/permease [Neisseria sp.]|uniref:ABC transporter ATP-binding protein/permease n=1 Tax=Neisseria sp. TaxID=192066 RepID=UPI0026DB0862|nr:ABC transporter ATP-binding protein/permease [Neisseria sp.]MDO4907955.1 ABC transporter ATP-binding protein/permease [Neisseria sp.]
MNTRPAVSLQAVTHRYGKTLALADVSLAIPRGVTVGLIGPDGVGKSTLLSLIAGVRVIQAGEVRVLGGDMAGKQTRQALSHRIAYMPQGLGKNLYPTLSVYENIDFHARLFGLGAVERKARIARLLEATGLAPFPDRAAGKLSGGMKQKLSLCCALVHSPDLLILDEPTTGVDPLSRRQFWALVNALRAEQAGMTVIVATAYIDEAEQFEHLLAMDGGRLLANRPTREVLAAYGAATLEEAYIKMLPPEKQQGSGGLDITPFTPDPASPPAIEAHGLTKRFGSFTAVNHVSFKIEKGEIFGFLGSNGCGKSTTMKMLTGLLPASEGDAELLGEPVDAGGMAVRMRVGYMSQAFSLYEELSVRQNLELHAKLYQMGAAGAQAVADALEAFDLENVAGTKPASLSLGIRQRLQLAAACLHHPEVLILDEPTSGVDPAARDMFWRTLLKLSRQDKITIFVSTHFMNEAERCDRISFMHKGRVLAVGTPAELVAQYRAPNLEEAFVQYLVEDEAREAAELSDGLSENNRPSENPASSTAQQQRLSPHKQEPVAGTTATPAAGLTPSPVGEGRGESKTAETAANAAAAQSGSLPNPLPQEREQAVGVSDSLPETNRPSESPNNQKTPHQTDTLAYWFATVWTFAAREAKELLRDKIRLFFAVMGPVIMLASVGWSISYDVDDLTFALLDRDQSVESRRLAEYFRGSAYFAEVPPVRSQAEAERALQSERAVLVVDIPPAFGRDVALGRQPEVALYVDGTAPFNGNTVSGYAGALLESYNRDVLKRRGIEPPTPAALEPRFMYNPEFKSLNGMVPNILVMVLMMIPAIMTALSVVREREIGSIANLYASPASVLQYLAGKQLPYLVSGAVNFVMLTAMVVFWFGVPLKGSFVALLLGSLLLVGASTGLGLLVSSFTRSQTAAFFIAALGTMIPTINFSGIIHPLSSLSGGAYAMGLGFPASWFQRISMGGFSKGLGLADFALEYTVLAAFALGYLLLASVLLKKQEK